MMLQDFWCISFTFWTAQLVGAGRTVMQPPRFIEKPPTQLYVRPDEPVILPCTVQAIPPPIYQWRINGKPTNWIKPYKSDLERSQIDTNHERLKRILTSRHPSTRQRQQRVRKHRQLWSLSTQRLTEGVIQCTASNRYGRVISDAVSVLVAKVGTFTDTRDREVTVGRDEAIRLSCPITTSVPPAHPRWMIRSEDGSMNFLKESRMAATDDAGNLYLLNIATDVHKKVTQTYVCSVNNPILRTIRTGPDLHITFTHSSKLTPYHVVGGRSGQLSPLSPSSADSLTSPHHRLLPLQQQHQKQQQQHQVTKNPTRLPQVLYHSANGQIHTLVNHSLSVKCILASGHPDSVQARIVWQWAQGRQTPGNIAQNWLMDNSHQMGNEFQQVDQLPSSYGIKVRHEGTELHIPRIALHHQGVYRCCLKEESSSRVVPVATYEVHVEGEPVFHKRPENTIVPVFGSVTMYCSASENKTLPKANVEWLVNGQPVDTYLDGQRRRIHESTLYLTNLTTDDMAVFQCRLSNTHGTRLTNGYLQVWDQPPVIMHELQSELLVAEKQQIRLPCDTIGAPKATIQWIKNGQLISELFVPTRKEEKGRFRFRENGDLEIEGVRITDSGIYTCLATNQFGTTKTAGRLVVRKRTRILQGPRLVPVNPSETSSLVYETDRRVRILEGSAVELKCEVATDHLELAHLRIVWTIDGRLLNSDVRQTNRRLHVSPDGSTFRVDAIRPADSGTYGCIAYTRLDNDSANLELLVHGRPDPPTELHVQCLQTGMTPTFVAILQWRLGASNNAPIGRNRIEWVTGVHRPNNPPIQRDHQHMGTTTASNISTDWTPKSITFSQQMAKKLAFANQWTVADSLDQSHSRSILQTLTNESARQSSFSTSGHEVSIVKLYADVVYHFRVRSENRVGLSDPTFVQPRLDEEMESNLCYFKPQPATEVPAELMVFGNHPNNLIVKWPTIPPERHNGPGFSYRLTINCLDCQFGPNKPVNNTTLIPDWSTDSVVFKDLITDQSDGTERHIRHWAIETFRTYEVRLSTENRFGSSITKSLIQTGQSGEGIPQLILDAPTVRHIGSQNVSLTWWRPSHLELDQKINGYFIGFRVDWCAADLPKKLCFNYGKKQVYLVEKPPVWSVANQRVIGGMKRGVMNAEGMQQLDESSTVENAMFSQKGSSSLTGENQWMDVILHGDNYEAVLRGLPGMQQLKVFLRVLNVQYAGPSSLPLFIQTREGVPDEVAEFTASFIGVNHVELAWLKPSRTNGHLSAYDLEVYEIQANLASYKNATLKPKLAKQFTIRDPERVYTRISGLQVDTQYMVRIWPRTAAGRGQDRSVSFRTAEILTQHSQNPKFLISGIMDDTHSVNISLARPSNRMFSPQHEMMLGEDGTYSHATPNIQNKHRPQQQHNREYKEVGTWPSPPPRVAKGFLSTQPPGIFYAQFRRVGDEFWEETQKEFQRPWIIMKDLVPEKDYEIRVVLVKTPGRSLVSDSKFIRIPTESNSKTLSWSLNESESILPFILTYRRSTLLIGAVCAGILVISSIVASVFLVHCCRKRRPGGGEGGGSSGMPSSSIERPIDEKSISLRDTPTTTMTYPRDQFDSLQRQIYFTATNTTMPGFMDQSQHASTPHNMNSNDGAMVDGTTLQFIPYNVNIPQSTTDYPDADTLRDVLYPTYSRTFRI